MEDERILRHQKVQRVLLVALFFNLMAWALKFLWGYWTQSISMQADGLHSLLDAFSSGLGFLGVLMAARLPDAQHPYGHSKFEAMAAIGIAVFVFIGCFEIVMGSVNRFWSGASEVGVPKPTLTAFVVLISSILANGWLSEWERRMAISLKSDLLRADALHTRSDFYASFSVVISLIAGGMGYPLVDPIAALVIAGFIGRAGVHILMDSTKILTDSSQIDAEAVERLAMSVPGIEACHAVRTRGSRNHIYMDMHLHVAPEMTMAVAHRLAHQVEETIMKQFHEVSEVVVHLEPHLPNMEND
jgi:cation diffusion facilitator family transporter